MRRRVDETAWAALDPDKPGRINQSALGGVWVWGTRREAVAYVRENGTMYRPPVTTKQIVKVRITAAPAPRAPGVAKGGKRGGKQR